jgi:predicted ATPase
MFLNNEIRRLILVPGLRGDQLRKWYLTDVPATNIFEGPFESYVPCLIDFWQQSISRGPINELNTALRFLELASSVGTRRLNESQIEMRVPRTFTSDGNDFVNVADVGLAVSAALPVLVALINAAPGQLVYIEHPELHLHPRAQWRMAQLLAQAAKRDIRLVIETHSSLLLQGILTCVAKDEIAKDKVALHWFSRDERGVTRVKMADLDERGRIGDWPSDFDDVEMRASNEYLDAIEKKLYANVK